MKIILALLLTTTTFSGGHKIENHNIYNGYNMISSISGVQISCPRCGHKLDRDKLCNNKDCNAYGYDK